MREIIVSFCLGLVAILGLNSVMKPELSRLYFAEPTPVLINEEAHESLIDQIKQNEPFTRESQDKKSERLNQDQAQTKPLEDPPLRVKILDHSTTARREAIFKYNWGLAKIGIHINSSRHEQKIETNKKPLIVAIVDTGCDFSHQDLAKQIWSNPGETGLDEKGISKATNGLDDDGNGFIDDAHGWDFVSDTPAIMDEHGHGTHIAGIIASVTGFDPDVRLMILKYYDAEKSGAENLKNSGQALSYAINMGAHIINYSGGGLYYSAEEKHLLEKAKDKQILVIAAAGNEGLNSDFFHFYPAGYNLHNIVSVGALARNETLFSGSNFGRETVHLLAPGQNIYSTLPQQQYGFMSGTSQATAFVSGLAARKFHLALLERKSVEAMKQELMHTAVPSLHLEHMSKSKGYAHYNEPGLKQTLSVRSIARSAR